jgi:uncharacterized membrane protein YoaK (UPF0700 family)
MIRYDRRAKLLAACLSTLAGYVDAVGFIALGGYFVSFMSGNTTRLAVGLAQHTPAAAIAAALVVLFVAGVVLGALAGNAAKARRPIAVLMLVAGLLALAAALGTAGSVRGSVVAMVLAMGAENAVFAEDGEVHIGLTYMTGTLVKLGQRLASALGGGDRLAWRPYLLLWLGLAAGAVLGAAAYPLLGLAALWIAAAAAAALAMVAARIGPLAGELPR